ncbi:F-box domain-containing protein [Mycena venus]|uniref:F-box domain-containing protein n=1 Tax=Mycena venus TaxID=2733690 RepID=A0A8H6XAV2_9AGAR|nr:F-box domain-containing protein [Mycena venus]
MRPAGSGSPAISEPDLVFDIEQALSLPARTPDKSLPFRLHSSCLFALDTGQLQRYSEVARMVSSSRQALAGPNFGHLSNRDAEYPSPAQNILVKDSDGRLRLTRFTRRDSTLPSEILTLIFIQCLPDEDFVIPSPTTAPFLLCAVCHRWRQITLSTRILWSSLALRPICMLNRTPYDRDDFNQMRLLRGHNALSFDCPELSDTEGADAVELYDTWLSRARGAPLSLRVAEDQEVYGAPDWYLSAKASLIKSLVTLSEQWRNLELDLPEEDLFPSLPVKGKYPLLEKLSLTISSDYLRHSISFCDAPKLREVFLYPYDRHIQLPWHQLTSLRIHDIILYGHSAHFLLDILGRASNLVDASLGITVFELEPLELPEAAVLLPYLQSLHLTDEGDHGSLVTFLACLKAPSLKTLSVDDSESPTDISPFLSFVSQSAFQLHTLKLSRMPGTTDLLIQCLKAIPSVVHLKLRPSQLDNTLLSQFTGHSDFLPKLESFHLVAVYSEITGTTPDIAVNVMDMLHWRWTAVGVTRLQSFRLAYNAKEPGFNCNGKIPGLDDALSSRSKFRRLQNEGMVLYVGQAEYIDYSL